MMGILYSIGHGNMNEAEFISLLEKFSIHFLADVRSVPYSRFCPHFNRESLAGLCWKNSITYVFMGDQLGGKPPDEDCYFNGKTDYDLLRKKEYFQKGIKRLIQAAEKNIKLAFMCSESDFIYCHRYKLIAHELNLNSILVHHISRGGSSIPHSETATLFD